MRTANSLLISIALAGLAPASAQIVVDHQPYPYGGSTSDLEYLDNFGQPAWNQAADDFRVAAQGEVRAVNWWGWYRADNPPVKETVRIRLYANLAKADLPGEVLYEQLLLNPAREPTGRRISVSDQPREFRFHSALPIPMSVEPNRLYWLEISQIGNLESWYYAEFARTDTNGQTFRNAFFPDWERSTATSDLAFQLVVPEPVTPILIVFGTLMLRRRVPP